MTTPGDDGVAACDRDLLMVLDRYLALYGGHIQAGVQATYVRNRWLREHRAAMRFGPAARPHSPTESADDSSD